MASSANLSIHNGRTSPIPKIDSEDKQFTDEAVVILARSLDETGKISKSVSEEACKRYCKDNGINSGKEAKVKQAFERAVQVVNSFDDPELATAFSKKEMEIGGMDLWLMKQGFLTATTETPLSKDGRLRLGSEKTQVHAQKIEMEKMHPNDRVREALKCLKDTNGTTNTVFLQFQNFCAANYVPEEKQELVLEAFEKAAQVMKLKKENPEASIDHLINNVVKPPENLTALKRYSISLAFDFRVNHPNGSVEEFLEEQGITPESPEYEYCHKAASDAIAEIDKHLENVVGLFKRFASGEITREEFRKKMGFDGRPPLSSLAKIFFTAPYASRQFAQVHGLSPKVLDYWRCIASIEYENLLVSSSQQGLVSFQRSLHGEVESVISSPEKSRFPGHYGVNMQATHQTVVDYHRSPSIILVDKDGSVYPFIKEKDKQSPEQQTANDVASCRRLAILAEGSATSAKQDQETFYWLTDGAIAQTSRNFIAEGLYITTYEATGDDKSNGLVNSWPTFPTIVIRKIDDGRFEIQVDLILYIGNSNMDENPQYAESLKYNPKTRVDARITYSLEYNPSKGWALSQPQWTHLLSNALDEFVPEDPLKFVPDPNKPGAYLPKDPNDPSELVMVPNEEFMGLKRIYTAQPLSGAAVAQAESLSSID